MNVKFLCLLTAFLSLIGCQTSEVDGTPLEATRDQRIDNVANEACGRFESCNGYGAGKEYASANSCKQDYKSKMTAAWPVDQCGNEQIDATSYDNCLESIKQVACTGSIWDGIVAVGKCTAKKVCTDAPNP